jgi:hypothetical protein
MIQTGRLGDFVLNLSSPFPPWIVYQTYAGLSIALGKFMEKFSVFRRFATIDGWFRVRPPSIRLRYFMSNNLK